MTLSKNKLAIIIVSWNVKNLLQDCLHSVFAELQASHLPAEVWVVDCASTDGSAGMVAEEFPQAKLLRSPVNLGFAGGNNLALRAMGFPHRHAEQAPAILLLNPDTVVNAGAFEALTALFEQKPQAGIAGAKLSFGDGSFQHGAYAFPGLAQLAIELDLLPLPGRLRAWLAESRFNGRYPRSHYEQTTPFPIDHPLGAAMLVRREAIWQVGLLDSAYKMYVEEVDWAKRIKQAGWQAYAVPQAQIVHLGGQSTGQIHRQSTLNLWRSRRRFYRKYYGPLRFKLAQRLVIAGMRRRAESDPQHADLYRQIITLWQGGRE